jgi:carbon storage regulator
MLVLSCKINESLVINGEIIVTVVEIRDDKVRLGVEAPPRVSIHRREVFDAMQRDPSTQRNEPRDEESFFA